MNVILGKCKFCGLLAEGDFIGQIFACPRCGEPIEMELKFEIVQGKEQLVGAV